MKHVKLLRRLRERAGANGPGITVAVVAMLVALTGVAFAAGGALTNSQKKEVKAIIKKEAKKLRGPAGAPGQNGAPGASGAKGETGSAGAPGKDGISVAVTPIEEGEEGCEGRGGVVVEKEGGSLPAEVCTGEKGAKGAQGEPWTPNNELPAGATINGVWAFSGGLSGENAFVPMSFLIPLKFNETGSGLSAVGCGSAPVPATCQVHYQGDTEFDHFCAGPVAIPKVLPGNLCVFEGNAINGSVVNANFKGIHRTGAKDAGAEGAGRAGALLIFELTGASARGNGVFALKAPNPIVTGLSLAQGPAAGGTSVTITGTNFNGLINEVKFGSEVATCDPVNAAGTEITCTSPAQAAGIVDVTVTASGYESPANAASKFTYE